MSGTTSRSPINRVGSDRRDISVIPGLTPDQHQRLAQVLDQYLLRLEAGEHSGRVELVAQHPDLAEHLEKYLDSLQFLQTAAGGFGTPVDPENPGDGQQLGDFRLVREIGRGGMAVVHEAWQASLGRTVALKVLPFAAMLDAKQIARFRNEAQALAQLEHPHIVPIFAVGEDRGVHYFAMRLIDGLALDRVIELLSGEARLAETDLAAADVLKHFPADRPRYFARVASLGAQIARALHAAHEYGIVHRDIKPSNLLLDRTGKPWVADFGLARWQTNSLLTHTGDIVGTARYMSPEQSRGESALVDHRTDVYLLGITLYELATLRPAFDQPNGPELLAQIAHEGPVRPLRLVPDMSVDFENVILKAIAPSRDERYATAQDLADDLERVLAGEPTVARAPTFSERLGKWVKRHRRAVATMAGMLLILSVASIVAAGLIYREKVKKDAALAEATRNFRQAREVVDRFGAKLADQLAIVPGAEDIRRSLLMGTIDYYRDFIQQSGGQGGLRSELATALNKIALLTEHVGTNEEALAAHEEARAAFEQLAKDEPAQVEHLANQALCENNIGLLLSRTSRTAEAEKRFRQAIELQRRLVQRNDASSSHARQSVGERPLNFPRSGERGYEGTRELRFRRDLALSYNNLGLLLSEQGRRDEAAEAYQSAVGLHGEIVKRSSLADAEKDELAGRYLAATHGNIAALEADRAPEVARKSYAQALSILHSLVTRHPQQPDLARDLALTCNNLGALQSRLGEHVSAAATYAEAIETIQRLLAASPKSTAYRRDLALSQNNFGLALARDGRATDAESAFRQAADVQQQLAAEHPESLNDASSLGSIWNNLSMALEGQQRVPDALAAYEQAYKIQNQVLKDAPSVPRYREFLDRTCVNFARVCREQNRLDKALQLALRRRELWPENPDRLWSIAVEFSDIAKRIRSDQIPSDSISMSRHDCLQLVAETLNIGVRHGLNREAAAEADEFRELMLDVQFRRLLGWSQ